MTPIGFRYIWLIWSSELAKEFDCRETSITVWIRHASGVPIPVHAVPLSSDERRELVELRRKLRHEQGRTGGLWCPNTHEHAHKHVDEYTPGSSQIRKAI